MRPNCNRNARLLLAIAILAGEGCGGGGQWDAGNNDTGHGLFDASTGDTGFGPDGAARDVADAFDVGPHVTCDQIGAALRRNPPMDLCGGPCAELGLFCESQRCDSMYQVGVWCHCLETTRTWSNENPRGFGCPDAGSITTD